MQRSFTRWCLESAFSPFTSFRNRLSRTVRGKLGYRALDLLT